MPHLTAEYLQQLLDLDAKRTVSFGNADCGTAQTELITALRPLIEEVQRLREENERLRLRVLSAAGDDLCRLTQEEIKELSSGKIKIPSEEEFLASCKNFHSQLAGEAGVLFGCLTLAQMIAENERLQMMNRKVTCVWCGHQFVATPQSQAEELYEHAKDCGEHPVKKAEAERDHWKMIAVSLQDFMAGKYAGVRELLVELREGIKAKTYLEKVTEERDRLRAALACRNG